MLTECHGSSGILMADDSNRIGSRGASGLELLRQISGVGAPTSGGGTSGSVAAASGSGGSPPRGAFGPRGSRVLPADFPEDQLDRRAARGTYLDILV